MAMMFTVSEIMIGSVIGLEDGRQGILAHIGISEVGELEYALINETGYFSRVQATDPAVILVPAIKLLTTAYRAYQISKQMRLNDNQKTLMADIAASRRRAQVKAYGSKTSTLKASTTTVNNSAVNNSTVSS